MGACYSGVAVLAATKKLFPGITKPTPTMHVRTPTVHSEIERMKCVKPCAHSKSEVSHQHTVLKRGAATVHPSCTAALLESSAAEVVSYMLGVGSMNSKSGQMHYI
jgi:hypothetical protein